METDSGQQVSWRGNIGLVLGPVLFLGLLIFPLPGLKPEAARLAAVMALTMIFWICEPVPLPVTALLGPCLCVVLGIADAKTLLASFGDPVVFVFLGSFLLAQAMMTHHLDRRLALTLLGFEWVGRSTRRILFVFGAVAAFISMWLSNTATTAMLLPIALGILAEMGDLARKQTGREVDLRRLRLSSGLLLMTAYAASVGGIGTPIGTPPNLIGIGMIHKLTGVKITFFQWMTFAVPTLVVMYVALYALILFFNPPEFTHLPGLAQYLRERKAALGAWTRGQVNSLAAFLAAVVLWVLPGVLSLVFGDASPAVKTCSALLPEGVVALLAASLLFFLPVDWKARRFTLTWEEAERIDWGTILLFGGGIALGSLMFTTGLAEAIGHFLLRTTHVSGLWGITIVSIAAGILISETTSNTASANMVIPLAVSMATTAGVNPVLPALGACLGASYGFMLPVSTPPNAIVYGSGMIPITKMMRTGIVFDVIGLGLILAGVMIAKWVMG
ncbi:MAG: DASS family sodium-coupled anion symporter [bacterium]|nr:DASS family sodium-coupled anion symporter [Candidatus Sumerlaeota bacterium]